MTWRLVVSCLILCLAVSATRNPGLKAKITKKGLAYANTMAMQALKKNVMQTSIPDESGDEHGFKYTVYEVYVSQFDPPSSSIDFAKGQGLKWRASGAYIQVDGRFRYKKWFVKGYGSFTAKISSVMFDIQLNIGEDSTGRPSITAGRCQASVGDVDFKFHGGASWLYNVFRRSIGKKIKSKLNDMMCPLVNKAVDVDAEKKMMDLPMTSTLAKHFLLDYRLTAKPLFTLGYMETYHKGEVFWKNDPTSGSPMTAHPMPQTGAGQSMLYLWLSDYVLDTFFYQAQNHGYLVHNLTAKDLPASNRGVLNTTCSGIVPKCVGGLIPAIGEKYPHSTVELRMRSTRVPDLKISGSGVMASFSGTIDLYARVPGRADTPFLVTLFANMSASVNISVANQKLYASISDVNLKLKAGKSDVGPILDNFLNFLVDGALKVFIIPEINEAGRTGFPLPVTKEITFQNTAITFAEDTVQISTDLKYIPKAQQTPNMNLPEVSEPNASLPEAVANTAYIATEKDLKLLKQTLGEVEKLDNTGPLKFRSVLRKYTDINATE